MPPATPPDDRPSLADEWLDQRESQSTRDRVYAAALQLYEPTRVRAVASAADVSKETARDYLKWFTDIGMLRQVGESPDTFVRNEPYFRWRRIQRLRTRSPAALEEELVQLTARERAFRDQYGAENPADIDALEHADYADLETVWQNLRDWETVRRRIRDLEAARRYQDREGATEAPA